VLKRRSLRQHASIVTNNPRLQIPSGNGGLQWSCDAFRTVAIVRKPQHRSEGLRSLANGRFWRSRTVTVAALYGRVVPNLVLGVGCRTVIRIEHRKILDALGPPINPWH